MNHFLSRLRTPPAVPVGFWKVFAVFGCFATFSCCCCCSVPSVHSHTPPNTYEIVLNHTFKLKSNARNKICIIYVCIWSVQCTLYTFRWNKYEYERGNYVLRCHYAMMEICIIYNYYFKRVCECVYAGKLTGLLNNIILRALFYTHVVLVCLTETNLRQFHFSRTSVSPFASSTFHSQTHTYMVRTHQCHGIGNR